MVGASWSQPRDLPTESNKHASASFHDYVNDHLADGVDGHGNKKNYIAPEDLEDYWTRENINDLLNSFAPPIILSIDDIIGRFLKTFSILAYIGEVGEFEWFMTHNQDDSRLPHESAPHGLACGPNKFFAEFSTHQWKFCPCDFSTSAPVRPEKRHLNPNCILPIRVVKLLSQSTADESRPVVQKIAIKSRNREEFVVFKTYNGAKSLRLWETEVQTFNAILQQGRCPYIVDYLGSFKVESGRSKYTIILEYANGGTLLDLFQEDRRSPIEQRDQVQLWDRLAGLFEGLRRMHGLESNNRLSGLSSLQSIHLDIKPANILVFKGEQSGVHNCSFKLADFGSSPTRVALTGQVVKAEDTGGTPMYSPPECCRDYADLTAGNLTVSPKADTWSLGCVLSEVLIWTRLGEQGRLEYERRRIEATRSIPRITEAGYSGCFHSIVSRLTVVDEMHQKAIKYALRHDTLTPSVSNIILEHMLRVHPDDRLPDINLRRKFLEQTELPSTASSSGNAPPDNVSRGTDVMHDLKPKDLRNSKSATWASTTSKSSNEGAPSRRLPFRQAQPPSKLAKSVPAAKLGECSVKLPMVTINDINAWREEEKSRSLFSSFSRKAVVAKPEGYNLLKLLKDRDQYFIIDDSETMKQHKEDVIRCFQNLAYLVKHEDNDGIDMFFMSDPKTKHNASHSSPLVKKIREQKFDATCNTMSLSLEAMRDVLGQKNIPTLNSATHAKPREASLYVLTDGNWGLKGKSLGGVDKIVETLVWELTRRKAKSSFLAIQFIRFGESREGIKRLRKLDNLAKPNPKKPDKKVLESDIVDHSSYSGSSVWKMLIGSIHEGVDNDSDDSDSDED